MNRGERVARAYVGAILAAEAVVAGLVRDVPNLVIVLGVMGALALAVPLIPARASATLRMASTIPPVVVALVFASYASPMGTVAWLAWAAATVWLCTPAGPGCADTLAERFHARVPRSAHRAPSPAGRH